ncbi:ABC transporter substrate-binding protein [Streptomyces sp. NPDC006367]|uniref:ABC transporter substrate-binding protein n=1 Tax=unclassified Streptomyces TaxID=2593676 RepID=UPI0033B9C73E
MPRSRLTASAVLALSVGLLSSACTTSSGPEGAGASGPAGAGTIRYGVTSDVSTFDPAKATAATEYTFARLTYATLVGRDNGGKIIPQLARTWKATPTSATFTLREDLTCSDGSPLTAGQVAASLRRYADPRKGSSSSGLVFGPGGTPEITADDRARTVSVELAKPWSDLVPGLALPVTGIVCAPGLEDLTALAKGSVEGAATGGYTLTKAQRGTSYTFERRKEYAAWPPYEQQPEGEPADTFAVFVVGNESTLANQVSTGALDYAPFTGPDATRFQGGEWRTKTAPILRMYLVLNEREGHPGADPEVRRAVAQAVDAAAYNKVHGGRGELMKSFADSSAPCVNTDASLLTGHDPAAAKKVLTGIPLKITGTNAIAGGAGNDYVQEVLRSAGAKTELRNVDNATWATEVLGGKGDWDVTVMAHLNLSGTLTNAAPLLSGQAPPAGRNFGDVQNPGFVEAFGRAMATVDEEEKCANWRSAQKALLERNDVVPLATVPVTYVLRKNIDGAMAMGFIDPTTLRVSH